LSAHGTNLIDSGLSLHQRRWAASPDNPEKASSMPTPATARILFASGARLMAIGAFAGATLLAGALPAAARTASTTHRYLHASDTVNSHANLSPLSL
jgi:hypothetical protein